MSDETSEAAEHATAPGTLTIPLGLASRLSREYTIWLFTRPLLIAVVALIAVSVSILLIAGAVTGDGADPALPIIVLFAFAGAAVGTQLLTTRSIRLSYPDGHVAHAALSDDELTSTTAVGSGTIALRALRSVHVTPNGVLVVMRSSFAVGILPRALFTEQEIAQLRLRVAELRRS